MGMQKKMKVRGQPIQRDKLNVHGDHLYKPYSVRCSQTMIFLISFINKINVSQFNFATFVLMHLGLETLQFHKLNKSTIKMNPCEISTVPVHKHYLRIQVGPPTHTNI